jgi:hypothetical protein
MKRILLVALSALLWLAAPALVFAQVKVEDKPAQPVLVVNDYGQVGNMMIIAAVNAILLVVLIYTIQKKSAEAPKT